MHINLLKESKFLKKEDCEPPILVTMKGLSEENLAMEGKPPEMKWCLHFMENIKPMTLNSTNAQAIASIVKSEETDDWAGHKIVLYSDPNISFGGKLVGGIRVRAPRQAPQAPRPMMANPAPAPAPATLPYVERAAQVQDPGFDPASEPF